MVWMARLLSMACIFVAAKMEYCAPALSELDAGGSYKFYSASVRRMELLVLPTLGWSMATLRPSITSPASLPGLTGTTTAAAAGMTPPAWPSSPSALSLPQPKVHLVY